MSELWVGNEPDIDPWSAPPLDPPAKSVRERLPLIDWHALWADEESEEWILDPILPARRLVSIYSPPKTGKSLLVLELAVAISTGASVLGATIDRARRVLYVDFENDPRGDIRQRLEAMGHGPDDLGGLCYLSFPTMAALDTDTGGRELIEAALEYGCEVIVIDTISRAVKGEENENDTWLNFYRHTGLRIKQAGLSLLRLDHSGKDETKGQRGGSAKSGDVDLVWRLSRINDTTFRLDYEANRLPIAEKTLVLHREQNPLRHRVDGAGARAAWSARLDVVLQALTDGQIPTAAGAPTVREYLRSAGITAGNDLVAEAVRTRKAKALLDPSLTVREPRGQHPLADLSESTPDSTGTGDQR